jgi:entry exclusion lipoprotein TrbK
MKFILAKIVTILFALLAYGCSNDNAMNKVNFENCVRLAEQKYKEEFSDICKKEYYSKAGECSYSIRQNEALMRSRDNSVTACATMYAPKR